MPRPSSHSCASGWGCSSDDSDERERLLEQSEARAAELERRLAVAEVELADAQERHKHLARTLGEARQQAADAEQAAAAIRATVVAAPAPPDPTDPFDPPPLEDEQGRRDARAHAQAAARLYEIRDFAAAARAYGAAAVLSPRDAAPRLGVARCMRKLGRFDAAFEAAQSALAIRPGWRDAAWIALLALARLERTADFEALVAEVVPPDRARPATSSARLRSR